MLAAEVHTLPNGLQLAMEEQSWNPGLSMQLWLPGGARLDPETGQGAANLLDSWLWKGSAGHSAHQMANRFDDLGIRYGSGAGLEQSSFGLSFLAVHLEQVLELLGMVLFQPDFPPEELESVRQSALQELASQEDQPGRKMMRALRRAVFRSPHGRSSTGTLEGLQTLQADHLHHEYTQRMVPGGALLTLAGGLRAEGAVDLVTQQWGEWQGQPQPLPALELSLPHALHLEQDTAQVQIGLIYPDLPPGHPQYYHSRLAAEILSGGMGSRLFTEVREKRGLVYSVGASVGGVRGYSFLVAQASARPEQAAETLQVMQAEIEGMARGVSQAELERAQLGLRTSLIMAQESARSRSSALARDLFVLGRVRSLAEVEAAIAGVTLPQLNEYLAQYPYQQPWQATLGPGGQP
jgi:predicted Zn-dependent peptidase